MQHFDAIDWAGIAAFSTLLILSLIGWAAEAYLKRHRIRMHARRGWPKYGQSEHYFAPLDRWNNREDVN